MNLFKNPRSAFFAQILIILMLAPYSALALDEIEMMVANALFDQCKADLKKHCDGVEPGESRIAVCLSVNKYDLSLECMSALESAGKRMQASQLALSRAAKECRPEITGQCPGIQPGRKNYIDCIGRLKSSLSNICRQSIANYRNSLRE